MSKKSQKANTFDHSNPIPKLAPEVVQRIVVLPDIHAPRASDVSWAVRQFCDEKYWSRVRRGVVLDNGLLIAAKP